MEALADTDDDTESIQHRFLLKWIKHFLDDVPDEIDSRFQRLKAEDAGKIDKVDPEAGGTPFMESDGDSAEIGDDDAR